MWPGRTDTTLTASADYAQLAARFDVSDIEALLGGEPDTGINACVKCRDRHAVTDAIAVLTMSARASPGADIHEVNVTYFARRLYKESSAVRPVRRLDATQTGEAMRNVKPSGRSWCAAALLGVLLLAYPELGAADQKQRYEGPLWDAHGHLWSAVGFGLADYGTLMQELGVVAGNLSNIDFHPGGAEEGARLAKRLFPSSVFPFVAVEIGAPPFDNMVKWVQQDPAFISEQLAKMETILARGEAFGIGEIFTQWGQLMSLSGPSIPADSPGMMKLAELAARYKVPLQIHHTIVPIGDEKSGERFADWERLLAKNPKTRFVMAHAGFTPSWISDGGPSGGPAKFRQWLGKFPNLYVELSWASNGEYFKRGLFATPLPFNAKAIAPITTDGKILRPEWKKLLEDFPDRFVAWGSDPTFNFNVEGKRQVKDKWELMAVVRLGVENGREILGQLPPELAARVAYKNGYGLLFP